MVCTKCGYKDDKEFLKFGKRLCRICVLFAPDDGDLFEEYVSERIDWKHLESFRNKGVLPGARKKKGMQKRFEEKLLVTRPPFGYSLKNGVLVANEQAQKVHSLFVSFLNKNYSLNSLAKHYGFSVNGIKKILTNRTYLGELKFDGRIVKSNHEALVSPELFYAVQRKLRGLSRRRRQ